MIVALKSLSFATNLFDVCIKKYNTWPDEAMAFREILGMEDVDFEALLVERLESVERSDLQEQEENPKK